MRFLLSFFVIVLGALVLSGCSTMTDMFSDPPDKLAAVRLSYAQIRNTMTQAEVVDRLGPPVRVNPDGSLVWEVRLSRREYERLDLTFNAAGHIYNVFRASAIARNFRNSFNSGDASSAYAFASKSPLPESVTGRAEYPANPLDR